jgi:hypothetical protein
MNEILKWLGEYSLPVVILIAIDGGFLFVFQKAAEKAVAQAFDRHAKALELVEVEPFEPSAKSAHAIYPLVRRSSMLLATSSQTSAKSRSSFLTTASSAFSASCRYVAACCRR